MRDCAYLLGGLVQGNTRSESRNHMSGMAVVAMRDSRGNSFMVWSPQLDFWIGIREGLAEEQPRP